MTSAAAVLKNPGKRDGNHGNIYETEMESRNEGLEDHIPFERGLIFNPTYFLIKHLVKLKKEKLLVQISTSQHFKHAVPLH